MKEETPSELLPVVAIHAFAVRWLKEFRDPNVDSKRLEGIQMGNKCKSLGFEMDSGHAFSEKYGKAYGDLQSLKEVIDDVDDIMLLGSAIYSAWRFFSYWVSGHAILEPENREWFILALSRLEVLSGNAQKVPVRTIGKVQRIKIHSNSFGMGFFKPGEEVEQHLTITRDGRVFFSSYVFGDSFGHYKRFKSKNFRIDVDKAERIMTAFEDGFSTARFDSQVCDAGNWTAEIITDVGNKYKFECALIGGINTKDGVSISNIVREELNMPGLYVFDGNCETKQGEFKPRADQTGRWETGKKDEKSEQ